MGILRKGWLPEHDDFLRKYAGRKSSAEMAFSLSTQLGRPGTSRNAVIGRMTRLNMDRLPRSYNVKPKLAKPAKLPKHVVERGFDYSISKDPIVPLDGVGVSYRNLNAFHCRAIIGEDEEGFAQSCGRLRHRKEAWCESHCSRFYTPEGKRRVDTRPFYR